MRRRRKFWIAGLTIAIMVTLFAVLTGGIQIRSSDDFDGRPGATPVDGIEFNFWLTASSHTEFSIPFLFYYWGEARPFDLNIHIWDTSKQYVTVEITEILIAYSDSDSFSRMGRWSRKLTLDTRQASSPSGAVEIEGFRLFTCGSDDLGNDLVDRHEDVTVAITGYLAKLNGERVDFSASRDFEAVTECYITTTLLETIAGV